MTRRPTRLSAALLAMASVLVHASVASACPQCARSDGDAATTAALGAFLLLPFAVTAIAFAVLRRGKEGP